MSQPEIDLTQLDFTQPVEKIIAQLEQLDLAQTRKAFEEIGIKAFEMARDNAVEAGNALIKAASETMPPVDSEEGRLIFATSQSLLRLIRYYQSVCDAAFKFDSLASSEGLTVN